MTTTSSSATRYERLSSSHYDERNGLTNTATAATDDNDETEEIDLNPTPDQIAHYKYAAELKPNHRHAAKHIANSSTSTAVALSKRAETHADYQVENGIFGAYLTDSRFMQLAICTLLKILIYLVLSISLTFYQKRIIKEIKLPLCIVSYHMVVKLMLAAGVRAIFKICFGRQAVRIDWNASLRKMAPTGIASGIDIGFSNWGLELVSISLYTMTKSSTIVFILLFAILLGLEKKSGLLFFTVGLIAIGLFMFTYKSTQFDALGFIFILVASLSSGVRWSFAQFVMQKSKLGLHNPVDMIYHMQPWMIASLVPFLIGYEGKDVYNAFANLNNVAFDVIYLDFLKITLGAVVAFLMEISEFLVLSSTSSLTLSIAGIFKDICQLALAVEINKDQLSLVNVLGLVVCLAGICCHLVHKYALLTKPDDNPSEEEFQLAESTMNGDGVHNISKAMNFLQSKRHSTQTVPLLEQHSDSEDSLNDDDDGPNASDVIFDVLKRRDMQH